MTMSGFMDCICSAPMLRPRIFTGTIFSPCNTHVEFVWSNSDQNTGTSANTPRIGGTDLAAAISAGLKRAAAADQKSRPGPRRPRSAAKKTLKNPA